MDNELNASKRYYSKFNFKTYLQRIKNPAIICVGSRGQGKSVLIKELIYRFSDILSGIIISYTEKYEDYFSEFFPKSFIYDKFSTELFEKVFERQRKLKAKQKTHHEIDTRILMVMDDCLAHKADWKNDSEFDTLLMDGRHLDTTFILGMQYPVSIKAESRSNFDLVILFYTNKPDIRMRYNKYWCGLFSKQKDFDKVFSELTDDHSMMIIMSRGQESNDIRDQLFWYSVDLPKLTEATQNFMFGGPQLKRFHKYNGRK